MTLDYQSLRELSKEHGCSYYLLDIGRFEQNYRELTGAFTKVYPKFAIAYSYKTNYIPRIARAVYELGGYAEVVSDMEMDIALRAGVPYDRIIFNGPYKSARAVRELLLGGGTVNIDSVYELDGIMAIALENPTTVLSVGIRVNFPINDGVLSRFGFDVDSEDFARALAFVSETPNIKLSGLNCHFASREIDTWRPRARGMLALIDKLGLLPERIDLGGGLYGKMEDELKRQFPCDIPDYAEYASAAATVLAEHYRDLPDERKPLLLIEPGSALAGDCMALVSLVESIKTVRGKPIATLLASMYNINMGKKNPPLRVVHDPSAERRDYEDLDFAGYTCIESDYLYRGYKGPLAVGDYAVFTNVGSYSIVFKPPFILPNFAVLSLESDGRVERVKRAETFEDVFATYSFEFGCDKGECPL